MSVKLTISIPPDLQRDLQAVSDSKPAILKVVAHTIENVLLDHFMELQGRPRADGFTPCNFWDGDDTTSVSAKIGDPEINGDIAVIPIDSPELYHKLHGGTVKPVGHPYLTIPATDEAAHAPQGARSFQTHIEWVLHPDGGMRPALVSDANYAKEDRSGKRRVTHNQDKANTGSGDVLFWLVHQVTHRPMPDALPSETVLADASRDAALDTIDTILNPGAAA